jgi:RNA polymerase sigma-70 factor (ECF subfamily)
MRNEEFERIYAQHAESLLRFLQYRTGDLALAEDLLADTFERVLTARRPFDRRRASEKTWLYAIAVNVLRDTARRSAAGKRAVERMLAGQPTTSGADMSEPLERRETVRHALECLSQEEREVIGLRFGAELTVPEIAKVTRQRLTTVEGRLYRALRKLRDELD